MAASASTFGSVQFFAAGWISRKRLLLDQPQGSDKCDHLPDLARAQRISRHLRAGNTLGDEMEYGQVVSRVQQPTSGEHGAPPPFAPRSVTIRALRSIDSRSSRDVLRRAFGLGCGFSRMLGAAVLSNREDRHHARCQPPHWDGSITSSSVRNQSDEAHPGKSAGGADIRLPQIFSSLPGFQPRTSRRPCAQRSDASSTSLRLSS